MFPAQMGIPGGPELLVTLVIFLLMAGGVVLLVKMASESDGGSERLAEVERRIGRLEARVDQLEDDERGGS